MQVGDTLAFVVRIMGVKKERKGKSEFIVVKHDSPIASFLLGEVDAPFRLNGTHSIQPEEYKLSVSRGKMCIRDRIYTVRGGIKTIVWTDTLQTVCILVSVGLTIYVVNRALDFNFSSALAAVKESSFSRVFDFDWRSGQNTVKQFLAGVAITVCLNGLDQNMMQKNLTCRSLRDCKVNMFSFSFLFLVTKMCIRDRNCRKCPSRSWGSCPASIWCLCCLLYTSRCV